MASFKYVTERQSIHLPSEAFGLPRQQAEMLTSSICKIVTFVTGNDLNNVMWLSRFLSISLGYLACLVKFSPNKFISSLLLGRKRTVLCLIFTALFISELLKLWNRSASWGCLSHMEWDTKLWEAHYQQGAGKCEGAEETTAVIVKGWKVSS